ncbi:MAG: thiamine-phosphate kinase [Acidobacteria bacterium]|nr:thiamine-phosphate kinase [Acidobacteriota bacterium]
MPGRKTLLLKRGIGDDCAIFSDGGRNDLLVTTDLFLEGVHFRPEWQAADSVGHKVLARGLSDIAAMGGTPCYAFLSLALPPQISSRWVDDFFQGLFRLAEASGVILAGGDTSASRSGLIADIMVIGWAPRDKAVLRSGARPGDEIWVSGALGGAAAGMDLLRQEQKIAKRKDALRPLFYPQPRLALGRMLARRGLASAMMDLSDGLSIDLARLCEASGVGARIEAESLPRLPETPFDTALHGGEDFELLFAVPDSRTGKIPKQVDGVGLTRIGKIIRSRRLWLRREGREEPLPVLGFQHF